MRSSTLLWAAPALSAAFLLPPNMNPEVVPAGLAVPLDLAISDVSISRILRLDCDGCPYKEEGVETDLIFDFNLNTTNPTKLLLNGQQVLPLDPKNPAIDLKAAQIPKSTNTKEYFEHPENFEKGTIGYGMMSSSAVVLTDGGYKHHSLQLLVNSVNQKAVNKVPGIRMSVKEDLKDGHLAFDKTEITAPGKTCTGITCLLEPFISRLPDRLKPHRKPCHKGKGQSKDHSNPVVEGLKGLKAEEKPHKQHMPHHHHGHHRMSMFKRICKQILFPISVGILAGLTVSVIGLVVGHALVMVYRKARGCKRGERCGRRGRRGFWGRRRRERMERERIAAEQEKGLLNEDGEARPSTEAPPAYVDEGLEVVEKE